MWAPGGVCFSLDDLGDSLAIFSVRAFAERSCSSRDGYLVLRELRTATGFTRVKGHVWVLRTFVHAYTRMHP